MGMAANACRAAIHGDAECDARLERSAALIVGIPRQRGTTVAVRGMSTDLCKVHERVTRETSRLADWLFDHHARRAKCFGDGACVGTGYGDDHRAVTASGR